MTEMFYLARPKLEGVLCEIPSSIAPRIVVDDGKRKRFEPIKNQWVLDILKGLPHFVGEIVVGKPIDPECRDITRLFLEEGVVAPFIFWVYDLRTTRPYNLRDRLEMAESFVATCGPCIQYVDHKLIQSQKELDEYKEQVIGKDQFKGVILREPFGTFGTYDQEAE